MLLKDRILDNNSGMSWELNTHNMFQQHCFLTPWNKRYNCHLLYKLLLLLLFLLIDSAYQHCLKTVNHVEQNF